ncbi:MAG: GTP-binding protein [Rhodospirillales bacterium]|nr:GTP-binding protein [Rhodospirillales bacterium]
MSRDLQAEAAASIPVTVITGFLGSGKTTLLNHLLGHPDLGEAAVLINEFGDVGIDHLLTRKISEDVVLLNSGCVCCSVRGDLVESMRDLFLKRVKGEIPEFKRLLIETTGLADPSPIIHTLINDPMVGARYRLDGIVTTVDCVLAETELDNHPESVKQVAVADRILMTKGDIADPTAIELLHARIRHLNPAAPIILSAHGQVEPAKLLDAGLFNASSKIPDVAAWLRTEAYEKKDQNHHHPGHQHEAAKHDDHITSFVVTLDKPVHWQTFATAIEALVATRGQNLLRVKGIVNAQGFDHPIVIHGVQHMFHPPVELPKWPSNDHRTRVVFIARDLGEKAVSFLLSQATREELFSLQ